MIQKTVCSQYYERNLDELFLLELLNFMEVLGFSYDLTL